MEIVGRTARSARNWGMPLVVEAMAARQGRLKTPFDAETIAMNTRIAVEIGADVIKTDWAGTIRRFSPCRAGRRRCAGIDRRRPAS